MSNQGFKGLSVRQTTGGQLVFRAFLQTSAGALVTGIGGNVSGATNASPIVIQTSAAHRLSNGQQVIIASVGGNTNANGTFIITVVDSTHFSLNGTTGNSNYTSGGTWSVLTSLFIQELQNDGSINTYDFSNNTFGTGTVTTESAAMTYRPSNNGATDTGLWTYSLSTLTGFTVGAIYECRVNNGGAFPTDQYFEFQFGGAEGDLQVNAQYELLSYLDTTLIAMLAGSWLYSTGATTPITSGAWVPTGFFSGTTYYKNITCSSYAWYSASANRWYITTVLGTLGSAYWQSAVGGPITGPYSVPSGSTATGIPTLVVNSNTISATIPNTSINFPANVLSWDDVTVETDQFGNPVISLGQSFVGTAATGSTSTVVNVLSGPLSSVDNIYDGMTLVLFKAGLSVAFSTITAYNHLTPSFTVSPALTAIPAAGDVIEVYPLSTSQNVTVGSVAAGAITDAAFTVPPVAPGLATGILGMVQQTWRAEYKAKTDVRTGNSFVITFLADDGLTTLLTQRGTSTGNQDTLQAAG